MCIEDQSILYMTVYQGYAYSIQPLVHMRLAMAIVLRVSKVSGCTEKSAPHCKLGQPVPTNFLSKLFSQLELSQTVNDHWEVFVTQTSLRLAVTKTNAETERV